VKIANLSLFFISNTLKRVKTPLEKGVGFFKKSCLDTISKEITQQPDNYKTRLSSFRNKAKKVSR